MKQKDSGQVIINIIWQEKKANNMTNYGKTNNCETNDARPRSMFQREAIYAKTRKLNRSKNVPTYQHHNEGSFKLNVYK